ncbi:MAG: nitroreductase family protein [candidate division Zixibacteria bacterium]
MIKNPMIESMLSRKSVRKFTDEMPSDEVLETIVRAGQQAPFVAQLYSILLSRELKRNAFHAPLLFTFCIDLHRMEIIMKKRGWKIITNDLLMFIFGIQDATLAGQNMVMAAESLGMGSVYLGEVPYWTTKIREKYKLPKRVFPFVQLAMGYPAENEPPRPRYPMEFTLFEDEYPEFTDETVERAMKVMDDGYMGQDYYKKGKRKIALKDGREETYTYDTYGWTEHISRKWGQWHPDIAELLDNFKECGLELERE